ncbi:MAG: hypothetical protein ACRDNL_21140 [Spirillospora sp.]
MLALGHDVALDADVFVETACRFDHPIGDPARALLLEHNETATTDAFCAGSAGSPDGAAFCVAHQLAPSDEVQRAVFFVRTGQHEQYRALDPDGALLAIGYRSAPPSTRAALREAMTRQGDIDTLRVLAGTDSRQHDLADLTEQERGYLVQQLASRSEWERLWRLTVLLPAAEAASAVHAFGGWRPPDADGSRLFQALRNADPAAVRTGLRSLSDEDELTPDIRFDLRGLDPRLSDLHQVNGVDFAADGTRLAFVGELLSLPKSRAATEDDFRGCAGILDLQRGTLVRLYPDFPRPLELVAYLGSDTIVAAEGPHLGPGVAGSRVKVHYLDREGVRTPDFTTTLVTGLERGSGDRSFLVSAWDEESFDGSMDAVFTSHSGAPLVSLGITDDVEEFLPGEMTLDPSRGTIAVLNNDDLLVAKVDGSAVNLPTRATNTDLKHLAMSPTVLICCDEVGTLYVWREPLTGQAPSATIPLWAGEAIPDRLAWSPALNQFVAVHNSYLELFEIPPAGDFTVAPELLGFRVSSASRAHTARLSPEGDSLAVANLLCEIDIYALTRLGVQAGDLTRPLGLMDHQTLAKVGTLLTGLTLGDESGPPLKLLRDCLEYRFRHDIGIGIGDATGTVAMADDDIELGG